MILRKLLALAAAMTFLIAPAIGADGITLEIMGSRTSWTNSEFTGHAFLCIALSLQSGIKEDCYGFYPTGTGPTAVIAGSGGLSSEFTKNPTRFSRVDASVKKGITPEQRRLVLNMMNDSDKKKFDVSDSSIPLRLRWSGNCLNAGALSCLWTT